jgi:5-methyltetrahydropteroyltriglutamate--homocysteine methyltransferase
MKRSSERILTTHVGSLPRPRDLLEMTRAKLAGEPYDADALARRIRSAVAEQVECGIDVVSDGEQSKDSFCAYVRERLSGITAVAPAPGASRARSRELRAFPEYYRDYYFTPRSKDRVGPSLTLVCTRPVRYVGQAAVQSDIKDLRHALAGHTVVEAFIPASAPGAVARNQYHATEEEFLYAVGEALREEYRASTDAGFLVQIEEVKLPEGKVIIPGVITYTSNVVEHPEVIAGADCGFSSEARFTPDVHPTVVWAKFQALAEGAALATRHLWP